MIKLINYFHPLERMKRIRKKNMADLQFPKSILSVIEQPYPEIYDSVDDLDFIVLDIETTGLNCETDIILSIGWVCINKGHIDLSSASHWYINQQVEVKAETVVINHITPEMLSAGITIADAMDKYFDAAQGKVMVAHACVVEKRFIDQYLLSKFALPTLPLIWIDTLCIEKKLENAISQQEDLNLTLAATRARYNLPEYNGHNALADAIATAELLLVQQKRIASKSNATLGNLYKMSL